jgi:WD40 repeat protein
MAIQGSAAFLRRLHKLAPNPAADAVIVLAVASLVTGVGLAARSGADKGQARPPELVGGRTDLYGDPLPPDALARLGTVRFRFAGRAERLAFSPDGTRLAYAGSDGVRVWEAAGGRPVRVFSGHADAVAFLDGGKRVAAGGEELLVWDVASDKLVARLSVKGGLQHSAYSPDGKLLAGVGSDGALRLVDAATGAVLRQFDGHKNQERPKGAPPEIGEILSVVFAPDGKALASACFQDTRVFIWDVATGRVRHTLPGHRLPRVVQFYPDGRVLAVGDGDRVIRLWDAATGRKLQQLRDHGAGIIGLAFSPDGLTLASGADTFPSRIKGESARDHTVRLWDLKTGKPRPLPGPNGWAGATAFAPDGKTFAVAGSGTTVYLIDLTTGKEKHSQVSHDGAVSVLALSPDGSTLASGGEDGLVHLWDMRTGQEKARLKGHRDQVSGLAFTPGGRELISCGYDRTVRVWDWRRGNELRQFARVREGYFGFDLAPDGKTLLLSTGQVWDVATGKQTGKIPNYKQREYPPVFSPDGSRVAAPGGPFAIVVGVTTGKVICRFGGHEPVPDDQGGNNGAHVECVAFSPDGRRAASGGAEGLAFVWDAATGRLLRRLQGHENPVTAIAFAPDGRTVATASGSPENHKEQTVRLWEVATGQERRRFAGHQAQVTSIVFARDGLTLISGSEDGTALVWDVTGGRRARD